MTKKHFIQIAKILKNIKLQARNSVFLSDENTTNLVVNNIRKELIKMFIEVNPNFDVDKFINAPDLTQEEMGLPL